MTSGINRHSVFMNNQQNCGYCGKPVNGEPMPNAKVYHWDCSMEMMRGTREYLAKSREEQLTRTSNLVIIGETETKHL